MIDKKGKEIKPGHLILIEGETVIYLGEFFVDENGVFGNRLYCHVPLENFKSELIEIIGTWIDISEPESLYIKPSVTYFPEYLAQLNTSK